MEKKMSIFAVDYTVLFGGYEEVAGGITLFLKREDAIDYLKKNFEEVKAGIEETGEEILCVSLDENESAMIETNCSTYEWEISEKVVY